MNPMLLASWEIKGERNSSVHAACDEADITYILEGKGGRQFMSPCRM